KLGFASALPFGILLPFVLLPWVMSMMVVGLHGPVWPTAPLRLIPAVAVISLLMGALAVGASSLASTPRAGVGWVLGLVLGTSALASLAHGLSGFSSAEALNPVLLAQSWPQLFAGVEHPLVEGVPALLGTAFHVGLWTWVAARRTLPSEAVM
ncbi:MAG TPA: hypothetical protein VF768_02350, partial [Holophagaceae bacterium]